MEGRWRSILFAPRSRCSSHGARPDPAELLVEDCDAKEVCVCACLGALATTRCCYRCGAPVGDTIGGEKKPPAAQICLRSMYSIIYCERVSRSIGRRSTQRSRVLEQRSFVHAATKQDGGSGGAGNGADRHRARATDTARHAQEVFRLRGTRRTPRLTP